MEFLNLVTDALTDISVYVVALCFVCLLNYFNSRRAVVTIQGVLVTAVVYVIGYALGVYFA